MKVFIFLLASVAFVSAASIFKSNRSVEKIYYDNYAVFKVEVSNEYQYEQMEKLLAHPDEYDLWSRRGKMMNIMVSPKNLFNFQNLTANMDIKTEMLISNVQSVLDEETRSMTMSRLVDSDEFKYNIYHNLEEIYALLDDFLTQYPTITEEIIIGKSGEGRTIRGIKISYKAGNPGVYIESNIHAREWITSATSIWLINELLTSQNQEVRTLAESHDWYIIPVLNVDGFVYAHDVDRMWRKNRRAYSNSKCFGVDINRNFDSHWMEVEDGSQDPCSTTNAGSVPLSEPESRAEADYVISIKEKIKLFLAFHSYGQFVIEPWGYSLVKPENEADLAVVAKSFTDAVEALPYKTHYAYGQTFEVLEYYAAGVASDWAYDQGIKLSYTVEMRDFQKYGFILPATQILSNCQEIMAGLQAMTKKGKELGNIQ